MRGRFKFIFPEPIARRNKVDNVIALPNTVVDEGEDEFLKAIFRDTDPGGIAVGSDFFVGLCDQVPDETDQLADITSEPGATGGYARQTLARNSTGWPTLTQINGENVMVSATLTFTASGADFDAAFTRAFLANVLSGAGILFAYSGPLSAAVTVLDGESFQMQYEFYAN